LAVDSTVWHNEVALPGVTRIAAGRDATYAVDTKGVVFAWGSNTYGQLGVAHSTTPESHLPVKVKFW
jgi:alpha-tubulin suppressor-like RCC1 family protein